MKVLIIYPNQTMTARAPLGIGYLASYLREAGHDMRLVDYTFIKCANSEGDDALREKNLQVSNPDLDKHGIVEKNTNIFTELTNQIEEYKPGLIGMSTVDPNHEFGIKLLKHCKEKYPEIPILVGGPLVTLVPNDIISEECVDIVGLGESEEAIVQLCDNLETGKKDLVYKTPNMWVKDANYSETKKIHKNPTLLPNIDRGLAPDLTIFDDKHFIRPLGGKMYKMATVVWTRGCVFHCSYCANETFYRAYKVIPKQYYRKKDVFILVDELQKIIEKHKLNFLFFADDIWPMHDINLVSEFSEAYKKYVGLPFSVNLQVKLIKEEAFDLAVDAGLRNICVGVESGSMKIRREILRRNYKNEDVVRAFNLAHKHKIRSSSYNIIGLPHETREDIMETIELNRKAKPDSATVSFFHPYRGAPLRKLCIEEGLIKEEDSKHEALYRTGSQLTMPQITKQELSNLMSTFQLYFKLPKEYWSLIKESEDLTSAKAQKIREDVLLPAFRKVQVQEMKYDFTKMENWYEERK